MNNLKSILCTNQKKTTIPKPIERMQDIEKAQEKESNGDEISAFGRLIVKDMELICESMLYQMQKNVKKEEESWTDLYADNIDGITQNIENLPFFAAKRLDLPTYLHVAANKKDFLKLGIELLNTNKEILISGFDEENCIHKVNSELKLRAYADIIYREPSNEHKEVHLRPEIQNKTSFCVQCDISNAGSVQVGAIRLISTTSGTNRIIDGDEKVNRDYLPFVTKADYCTTIEMIGQDIFVSGYEGSFVITSFITEDKRIFPIVSVEWAQ